ncbi:MAG: VWA domain-containing protein [Bacteroidetes bacterium]|nr:VWA domain-containing protein [Bacteroidota bacterium]
MHSLLVLCLFVVAVVRTMAGGGLEARGADGRASVIAATSTSIDVTILDQVAETRTRQTFVNTSASSRTLRYGFPLPSGATVTTMRWFVHGTWFVASMKAEDSTGQQGGTGGGAGLSSFPLNLGTVPFVLALRDTLEADSSIIVELTYGELLPLRKGALQYVYPTSVLHQSGVRSVDAFSMSIRSDRGIDNVVVQGQAGSATTALQAVPISSLGITASFILRNASVTMGLLSTKRSGEDGYAVFLISPRSDVALSEVLPKRFTFVIDHSGSMSGTKMQQVKDAVQWCLQRLNPDDRFNVLAFDNSVSMAFKAHVRATSDAIASATTWVGNIQSNGGTDIMLALGTALKAYTTADYVNVIVFLTDGIAVVDQASIVASNTMNTRIFVLGVGSDVATDVLQGIADRNRGAAEFVTQINETTEKITALFERISDPLIKDPTVSCSPDVLYDMYPGVIQDLYAGDQLVLVSRYRTAGPVRLTVSGTDRSGPVTYTYDGILADSEGGTSFVGKLWAQRRIDFLLALMKNEPTASSRYGEWKKEVISLGITYMIVTPFTTLYDNGQKDPTAGGGGSATDVRETVGVATDDIEIVCAPSILTSTSTISFTNATANDERVVVEIYTMSGVLIATLLDEVLPSGTHRVQWDGRGADGNLVSAAQYVVRVRIGNTSASSFLTVLH